MFDWKLIVTLMIVFSILLVILGADSSVGKFFGNIFGKIGVENADNAVRNVSFSLSADDYAKISFSSSDARFVIDPKNFSAAIESAAAEAKTRVEISGFRGSGSVDGNSLAIEGSLDRIDLSGTSINYARGSIKASAVFDRIVMENIAVDEIMLSNGTLAVNGNEIKFSDIVITSPKGRFTFDKGLKIEGIASRISIPSARIVIG